ncbi:MAG: hypothetical protein ACYTG5_23340 [Planctomycetota bacterium]|jgi:hypothetical protein
MSCTTRSLRTCYNGFGFSEEDLRLDDYADRDVFIDPGWCFDYAAAGAD